MEFSERWKFLRAAVTRSLKGSVPDIDDDMPVKMAEVHPGAKRVKDKNPYHKESYIVKQQVESPLSYRNRVIKANDGGEARRVVTAYVGDISRAGYTFDDSMFSEEMRERIANNIDGKHTTLANFVSELAEEIAGIGKAYTLACSYPVGSPLAGIPYAEILPRECVTDSSYNANTGVYDFVTTEQHTQTYTKDFERVCDKSYLRITGEAYEVAKEVEGICKIISSPANPIKVVPVAEGWFGKEGLSLVDTIADIQFLLMNSDSILNQKITLQALNILQVPNQEDIDEQLQKLSAQTYLRIGQGQNPASWLAYPALGLDADFKYIERLIKQALESSARTATNPTVETSGYRQSFSWLDTETNLHILAEAVESCVNDTLRFMGLYQGVVFTGRPFRIKRQFDPKGLKEKLEIILQAMGIGIGTTAEIAAKKVARDSLAEIGVHVPADQIAQSDKEIEEGDGLGDLVQGLQDQMNKEKSAVTTPEDE